MGFSGTKSHTTTPLLSASSPMPQVGLGTQPLPRRSTHPNYSLPPGRGQGPAGHTAKRPQSFVGQPRPKGSGPPFSIHPEKQWAYRLSHHLAREPCSVSAMNMLFLGPERILRTVHPCLNTPIMLRKTQSNKDDSLRLHNQFITSCFFRSQREGYPHALLSQSGCRFW